MVRTFSLSLMMLIASMLALTACNLAAEATEEIILDEVATSVTVQPTIIVEAETTPELTEPVDTTASDTSDEANNTTSNFASAAQTNTTLNPAPGDNGDCTLRTDLATYTVVSGDTLYSIATAHDSTVSELSVYNCLVDINILAVGQQLYVPDAVSDSNQSVNGNVVPSVVGASSSVTTGNNPDPATLYPSLSPYVSVTDNTYHVTQGTTLHLTFYEGAVEGRTTQVEFIYTPDVTPNTNISIGIDSDFSNGIEVTWIPPNNVQGTITVAGRYPGQTHEGFTSQAIAVQSVDSVLGPMGTLMVTPNIQAGTPQDWSDFVVEAGKTVTIQWSGINPEYYKRVSSIEFFYYPNTGGIVPLGEDTNKADGMTMIWVVPENTSGGIAAHASTLSTSSIISPRIHVRTPNTEVTPCAFNPYGIGGPVPVYPIPNTAMEPIQAIMTGTTYALLGKGGTWTTEFGGSGIFYHIDLGEQTGWVQDGRGGLVGDCEGF